jgi:hypothetical protein
MHSVAAQWRMDGAGVVKTIRGVQFIAKQSLLNTWPVHIVAHLAITSLQSPKLRA